MQVTQLKNGVHRNVEFHNQASSTGVTLAIDDGDDSTQLNLRETQAELLIESLQYSLARMRHNRAESPAHTPDQES